MLLLCALSKGSTNKVASRDMQFLKAADDPDPLCMIVLVSCPNHLTKLALHVRNAVQITLVLTPHLPSYLHEEPD
jgi:hypothetical protein